MKIPRALIKYYFDSVVSCCLDENEDVPSDMGGLDKYMPNLKATLMANHEQLIFALGLKKILDDPREDLQKYYGGNFPLEDYEIRSIMSYLLGVVSPNDFRSDIPVVITEESIESDRIERGLLYKVGSGVSLKTVADKFGLALSYVREVNPYWYRVLGDSNPIEMGRTVRLKMADEWR